MSNEDITETPVVQLSVVELPEAKKAVVEYLIQKLAESQQRYTDMSTETSEFIQKLGQEMKVDPKKYVFDTDILKFVPNEQQSSISQ